MNNQDKNISRRDFLKSLGVVGGTLLAATNPWLRAFSDVDGTASGCGWARGPSANCPTA